MTDARRASALIEIIEAQQRFAYAADEGDANAFARCFTEFGVFETVSGTDGAVLDRLEGHDAIEAMMADRMARRRPGFQIRHLQSGTVFDELSDDAARTRTMLLAIRRDPGDEAPCVAVTGVYHDEWRRESEGWRMAVRSFRMDRPTGTANR